MKTVLIPFFCLVLGCALGGAGGYWAGIISGGDRASSETTMSQSQTVSGAPSAVTAAMPKAVKIESENGDQASTSKAVVQGASLAAQLGVVLTDYEKKRGMDWTSNLTPQEVVDALKALDLKPSTADTRSLRWYLYRAMAKTDPEGAWKAALALKDEAAAGWYLGAVAGEVAKTNAEAALKMAMSLGMGEARGRVLQEVFDEWGKVNLPAAVGYWNAHPDLPLDAYAIGNVIGRVAEKDPMLAATQAASLLQPDSRHGALGNVMYRWVAKDPEAALQWAQSIRDPAMRDEVLGRVVEAMASKHPDQAIEELARLTSADARSSAMQRILSAWFRKDPQGAFRYVANSTDSSEVMSVSYSIGYWLNGLTPEEQSQLLGQLPDGQFKAKAVRQLARTHIDRGRYAQALTALNSLPDSSDRDYTLHQLGERWGGADAAAMSAWLKSQPDSTDRDLVVAGFALALAKTDPASAIPWAAGIPDDEVRRTAFRNVFIRWMQRDRAAATRWIETVAGFPDSEKQLLLNVTPGGTTSYIPHVTQRR